MTTAPDTNRVVEQKLAAFERLKDEFEASFHFKQDVHGQKRFSSFPVVDSVRYLHALWVCECKDRLLSIYKNIERYEGKRCLELLSGWQRGETAEVVEFLNRKLDMLPLVDITRQIQDARLSGTDSSLIKRLEHGRLILLNRGMNLFQALDGIFALTADELTKQVQAACKQFGHLPDQISAQLTELESQLYSYTPHQLLARQNMIVMNKLGVNVMTSPTDQPGDRSWRVLEPIEPMSPYAEQVIEGYLEMTSPLHNNLKRDRFIDRPEVSDTGIV